MELKRSLPFRPEWYLSRQWVITRWCGFPTPATPRRRCPRGSRFPRVIEDAIRRNSAL